MKLYLNKVSLQQGGCMLLYYIYENVMEKKDLVLVKWNFEYRISKKRLGFNGISELLIKKNLIYKHIDYWDSGKNVYSNLPLIGSIFRKIHNLLLNTK